MINVLLVDAYKIVREGMTSLFKESLIKIVAEASCAQSVLEQLSSGLEISVIIITLYKYHDAGLKLIKAIQESFPIVKVVLLCADDKPLLRQALNSGANGFFLMSTGTEELYYGLRRVMNGMQYISSDTAFSLLEGCVQEQGYELPVEFSARELEVLTLVGEGLTNSQIGERLFTSKRTVEGYRQHLLEKTKSLNTATLVRYAIINRLIA
jgi:two-component system response regulator NreC